jgi:hypothetical protein
LDHVISNKEIPKRGDTIIISSNCVEHWYSYFILTKNPTMVTPEHEIEHTVHLVHDILIPVIEIKVFKTRVDVDRYSVKIGMSCLHKISDNFWSNF